MRDSGYWPVCLGHVGTLRSYSNPSVPTAQQKYTGILALALGSFDDAPSWLLRGQAERMQKQSGRFDDWPAGNTASLVGGFPDWIWAENAGYTLLITDSPMAKTNVDQTKVHCQ